MNQNNMDLIHQYLNGTIADDDLSKLKKLLRESAEFRQTFRSLCTIDEKLHELASSDPATWSMLAPKTNSSNLTGQSGFKNWFSVQKRIVAAFVVTGLAAWLFLSTATKRKDLVARFGTLNDCRWVDSNKKVVTGDRVFVGQRVDLSAGQAEIVFQNGAVTTLTGPCIYDVESANSVLLTLGQVKTLAVTPEAKGFTVRTRTARVVDLGTEFVTSAGGDGQSRVDVTAGEVEVHFDGAKVPQKLGKGNSLSVEPGSSQVIVRIESGDETSAFHFPTIEPPSDSDAADKSQGRATIRVANGELENGRVKSAPPEVLLDGHAQTHADAPEESCYFADGAGGRLLMDLGRVISIARINCYSWHQNGIYADQRVRATQKFTLYGFAGDQPPPTDGSPQDNGWVRIARVNSDEFFRVASETDRPAQQASSISGVKGVVGNYRYLLWDLQASRWRNLWLNNTFYGEFDVHEQKGAN